MRRESSQLPLRPSGSPVWRPLLPQHQSLFRPACPRIFSGSVFAVPPETVHTNNTQI